MLNPTQNRKDRGITRISAIAGNIARPPKTRCGKRFAGKTRAENPGKSGLLDATRAGRPGLGTRSAARTVK